LDFRRWTVDVGRLTGVIGVGSISVSRRTAFDSAPRYKKKDFAKARSFFVPRLKSGVINLFGVSLD